MLHKIKMWLAWKLLTNGVFHDELYKVCLADEMAKAPDEWAGWRNFAVKYYRK